jgi:hypothetical protein
MLTFFVLSGRLFLSLSLSPVAFPFMSFVEDSALSSLPAAISQLTSVTSALAEHLRTERKMREAHLVSVRLWNSGSSASAVSSLATEPCAAKKLRVSSFEELWDKVARSFSLLAHGMGSADAAEELSELSLSPAASSLPSPPFTLYYLLDRVRWWESRVKVEDEDSFEVFVSRPPYLRPTLLVWRTPADCNLVEHQQLHASHHHHSPLKDGAPPQQLDSLLTLLPSGGAGGLTSPAKSSASSRSSAQQADFADAVRQRDDDRCVVCAAEQVEAAHVVPVKDDRTAASKAAAQLLSLYDLRNGLTLCTHCHDYFDAGLWCISPVDRSSMQVSDALLAHRPAWAERQGAKVRLPSHHTNVDNWPSTLTLQVQVDFMAARQLHRLNERKCYPFACGSCGTRLMTKGGLTHHGKYCGGRGHLKPGQFHTPMKQPPSQHRRQQREKDNAEEAKHDLLPASAFDAASSSSSSSASSSRASHAAAPNTSHASSSAQVNPASTRSMRLRNKQTHASGLQK